MSRPTIFGLTPFKPKRTLVLPCQGGEITLYVLDGRAYPYVRSHSTQKAIDTVHFGGWAAEFDSTMLVIPDDALVSAPGEEECCDLEVAFRLVPTRSSGQTAEVVAISFDGCKTFYENKKSRLPTEHNRRIFP